jgi:hypothetical protein
MTSLKLKGFVRDSFIWKIRIEETDATISCPIISSWIRENEIESGDEVIITIAKKKKK